MKSIIHIGIQEKLGILNGGEVSAVFSYDSQQMDELSFEVNDKMTILRKGDDAEREWWWARLESGNEGYVPRNLFGVRFINFSLSIVYHCLIDTFYAYSFIQEYHCSNSSTTNLNSNW